MESNKYYKNTITGHIGQFNLDTIKGMMDESVFKEVDKVTYEAWKLSLQEANKLGEA